LKSNFSGKLLSIASLVEKTFGEGYFRILGTMTNKPDSAIQMLEVLRKARLRKTKNKDK